MENEINVDFLDDCIFVDKSIVYTTVNVDEFGARGDGITDDTKSFQMAVNSGAGVITATPGKVYVVNGLVIENKKGVIINGQGASIIQSEFDFSFLLKSCSWCTISHFEWVKGIESSICIIVDGGVHNTLEKLRFENVARCIWLRSSTLPDTCRESTIQNIKGGKISEWGIWVGGVGFYGVHDITYDDIYLVGIADKSTPEDKSVGLLFDFSGMAGQGDLKGNHRITNTLTLGFATGIKFDECNEAFVSNCQIDGCFNYGLRIMASVRMLFSNLWSSTIWNGPGIHITSSKDVTITSCYCYNNPDKHVSLVLENESELYIDGTTRFMNGRTIQNGSKLFSPEIKEYL